MTSVLESEVIMLLGWIKNAEMELSEAAFKADDGEYKTARECIHQAVLALGEAGFVLSRSGYDAD